MTTLNTNYIFIFISIAAIAIVLSMPAIPQDPAYHQFADQRLVLGVVNFYNVLSNLPFIIAGLLGTAYFFSTTGNYKHLPSVYAYRVFYIAITLVGLGSSVYHLSPDNSSLIWDRLPMAIAFMSFFTIIIGDYIATRIAAKLFIPLLVAGIFSVIYWHISELYGAGDLRPYALVQFLPILLIIVILLSKAKNSSRVKFHWMIIGVYVLAKIFEIYDAQIYATTHSLSGHSIKHLISALAPLILLYSVKTTKTATSQQLTN